MNKLVTESIDKYKEFSAKLELSIRDKTRLRIIECFGESAFDSLRETNGPGVYNIIGTKWDLTYSCLGYFSIWNKDTINNKGQFHTGPIYNLTDLGRVLDFVINKWGI